MPQVKKKLPVIHMSEHWSRHPLFVAAVGFILTGCIGAGLTFLFNGLSTEREHKFINQTARWNATLDAGKAFSDYYGAAVQLDNDMTLMEPPNVVEDSFKTFQAASRRVLSAVQTTAFILIEPTFPNAGDQGFDENSKEYKLGSSVRQTMELGLVGGLTAIGACLADRYHEISLKNQYPRTDNCSEYERKGSSIPSSIVDRIEGFNRCSIAVTLILLRADLALDADTFDDNQQFSDLERFVKTLQATCPIYK
jgi:hypothetical protein